MKTHRFFNSVAVKAKHHRKQRQPFPYARIARMWVQQGKTIAQIASAIGRVDKDNPKDSCHSVRNAMYRMRRWGYTNEDGKRVKLGSYRVHKSTRRASRVAGLRGGRIRRRK